MDYRMAEALEIGNIVEIKTWPGLYRIIGIRPIEGALQFLVSSVGKGEDGPEKAVVMSADIKRMLAKRMIP